VTSILQLSKITISRTLSGAVGLSAGITDLRGAFNMTNFPNGRPCPAASPRLPIPRWQPIL
jgi:hypothetical protein